MGTILLVGEDSTLLEIRSAVLATLGAKVFAATAVDLPQLSISENVDVVVLCHTVQAERHADVMRTVQEKWKPRAKILQIAALGEDRRDTCADFFTDSSPEMLIEHTKDLLARQPADSGTR